jgi:hypothetical protein
MTHSCTLREDNEPCRCEAVAAKQGPGADMSRPCAYRYEKTTHTLEASLDLNEVYAARRAQYAQLLSA